ncbi:hypothetical protein [Aeromonas caviae]
MLDPAKPLIQPVWEQIFPPSLAAHHPLIAYKLLQAIDADIELGADLTALLSDDDDWLLFQLDDSDIVCPVPDSPAARSHLDAQASQLRQQLKTQRLLGHYYLVDCILAELQHGRTLNGELFAVFKKVTLLCAVALLRQNQSAQIPEDGSIDAALRNVRLAADQRRGALLILLSQVDFTAPLRTVITTLEALRPTAAQQKTLTGQVDSMLRVLERLATDRLKQDRSGGGAHRAHATHQIGFRPLPLAEEQWQITILSAMMTRQGRRVLSPDEREAQGDIPAERQTWLIEQPAAGLIDDVADPARVPPSMDWQARAQQSRSVALAMALRQQRLPCDPGCALPHHIVTLVRGVSRISRPTPADLALLALLVLGLDWSAIIALPLWHDPPHRVPAPGKSYRGPDQRYQTSGIWCYDGQFALQRWHQVAHSKVHRGLEPLLPPVAPFILLPLPAPLRPLIDGGSLQPCSHRQLQQALATLCRRYQLTLTLSQLSRYQAQWLQRAGVDQAICGVLRGQTAQQCAPLAYSHLSGAAIVTVWHTYLAHIGLDTPANEPADDCALGSRLLPRPALLRDLLARYQQGLGQPDQLKQRRQQDPHWHNQLVRHTLLLLNVATGARPVTDMYGMRSSVDPRLGMIQLVDKEARDTVSAARLVPLAPQALTQLAWLVDHLTRLATRREPSLQAAAEAARAALADERPLLFWLAPETPELGAVQWAVHPITVQSMSDCFDRLLPLPVNWHRHALRSWLLTRAIPAHLIDAVLGHEEMGQEFGHPFSGADLNSLRALGAEIGGWLDTLGLQPLAGWGGR